MLKTGVDYFRVAEDEVHLQECKDDSADPFQNGCFWSLAIAALKAQEELQSEENATDASEY